MAAAVIGDTGSLCWLHARLIWKALSILMPGALPLNKSHFTTSGCGMGNRVFEVYQVILTRIKV